MLAFILLSFFFLCTNPTPFGCYENKAIIIIHGRSCKKKKYYISVAIDLNTGEYA